MRSTVPFAIAATFLLMVGGEARAKGLTLDQLQALATGLGYESTIEDENVVIPEQGKSRQNVYLRLVDDGSKVELTSPFYHIAGDKKAALPYEGLLRANQDGPFAFAMGSDDKDSWIDLQGFYDSATLSKQGLRKALDALVAELDATDALWNQDLWPAAAVPKAASAPAIPAPVPPAPAPAASGTTDAVQGGTPGHGSTSPPPT